MTAALVATAVAAFAGTTIDDLLILAALFPSRRTTGSPRHGDHRRPVRGVRRHPARGATGGDRPTDRAGQWVDLLGPVPIGCGGLWRLHGSDAESRPVLASTGTRIAAITVANGADNISVCTLLFRTAHPAGALLATLLFLALAGIWCGIGALLASHRAAVPTLGRVSHWLVPAVFIAVSALILIKSGTLTWIQHLAPVLARRSTRRLFVALACGHAKLASVACCVPGLILR